MHFKFAAVLLVSTAFCAWAEPPESPAEIQRTQELNRHNAAAAQEAYQQSQDQQQQYQQELQQYRAEHRHYEAQAASYEAQRDRYAAERAHYHRGEWPEHYEHLYLAPSEELLDAEVQTYDGRYIGHVEEVAHGPSGDVDALRVALRNDRGDVWVDKGDLRYDPDGKVVMTDLDLDDLRTMSKERFGSP